MAAERFLSVLEKNPRRGTALDRVYGFHIERGSLEKWLQSYRDRVAMNEKDGLSWMMLGLIEAHRGQDAAAVKSFQKAEQFLPDSPLASYYLGQSLILVGQPDQAAQALERAIDRKPLQADLLDVFQALGRVYQRAQKPEQALDVWNRLEKLFPNDLRVQEQIAQTLVEEGQLALALPRFEALIKNANKDLYRRSQFQIQVAEIKVRLGKANEGLADFETLLGQLNPDNWLYRDVRHKVDEVFLRNDDQAGLAAYYETWIGKHPEDVDAMARLARILSGQGRMPEAQQWLEKGLKLAPSRKELRTTIIDQLVYDQKYPEAIQQYELLDRQEPNNPDTLRDWGRLILKDTSRPEMERRQAAAEIWGRMVTGKAKDPVITTQVADLLRHAEMTDEALKLYQTAVELAPDAPQYREYLGEYYHQLKRADEALATWRQIVAGKNHTSGNLARLAEVLMGFGYIAEGTEALAEAVQLEPKDFERRLQLARAYSRTEKFGAALEQLQAAESLVTTPEEAEAVLKQQVENYQADKQLASQIEALQKELSTAGKDAAAGRRWYVLARYLEADRKPAESLNAVHKALEIDPKSVRALATLAGLQEASNRYLDAAETNRKLAAIDRRYRTEYLTKVARLEARMGRRAEALQAGRDVIAAAPGNPDSYEFFAQLCFQLGQNDEGLETLRRSVRVNPSDPKVVLALANALAEQFKTAEAIELYWRAFDKNSEIDGRLDIVTRLAELYLQTNHLDRLLERLERERREDAQRQRVMTLCLAQAHQAAGDYGTARNELERMLTPDTRDTPLLQQLAKLAEAEGDLPVAIKYQQQLLKVAPGKDQELQLANYLAQSGETEQASQMLVRIALAEKDPEKLLRNLDNLLQREQFEQSLSIIERLLREQPRNWEYLYREAVALNSSQPEKAQERFRQILELNLPDEELGIYTKAAQQKNAGKPPSSNARQDAFFRNPKLYSWVQRVQAGSMIRYVSGLENRYRYSTQSFWSPTDYGSARMAAWGWMMAAAQKAGGLDAFIQEQKVAWEADKSNPRKIWDWYYIQSLQQDQTGVHEAAKALMLADKSSQEAAMLYMISVNGRANGQAARRPSPRNQTEVKDETPPLPPDELALVLDIYKQVQTDSQFADILNSYYGVGMVNSVVTELKRAKRDDEAKQLFEEAIARARKPEEISQFMSQAAAEGNVALFLKLWDTYLQSPEAQNPSNSQYRLTIYAQYLPRLMAGVSDDKKFDELLSLLDRYFAAHFAEQRVLANSPTTGNKNYGNPYGVGQRPYYQIWMSRNNADHTSFDFPAPNSHFDYYSILVLRNAYSLFAQADRTPELMKYLEQKLAQPDLPANEKIDWQLARSYLHWWTENQDLAVSELQDVAAALPDDLEFRLDLAQMYQSRDQFAEALETLNSIQPLDQDILQRRETMALGTAIQVGDIERARDAAARLFGLRLDAETQVQLASRMKQLGMHEQADAVMARAGRQAGNRMGALVTLMREFQSQGKPDTALQIARTILRRTQSRGGPTSRYSNNDSNASYRQQAVKFLVDSGKLKELIERTESQLKNSPNSIQLHNTLLEFYTAQGDKEKAKAISLKLSELNQNDPQAKFNLAKRLLDAGEIDKSVELFVSALKQQPRLFANEYWEVQNAFRRAKRTKDLVRVLDQIDLKQMGQSYVVSNIISELVREKESRDTALNLLKRAWVAFPDERSNLLSSIYDDEVWQLPEMYAFAREAFIPQEGQTHNNPWAGFDIRSYSGDGSVSGSLGHMLNAAKKQNKTAELLQEIDQALVRSPKWYGGVALQAMLRIDRGDKEIALTALQELLKDKEKQLTGQAAWLIGQELKRVPSASELSVEFYEFAYADPNNGVNGQFQYSPGASLVTLFEKGGQKERARDVLVKAANRKADERYDQQYASYMRIQSQYEIGERLRKLGYPIDALRVFNAMLGDRSGLEAASQYGSREYENQARKGLEAALVSIDPSQLVGGVDLLLQPSELAVKDPFAPAVDLFLSVRKERNDQVRVVSLLETLFRKLSEKADVRSEILKRIDQRATERPDDVSLPIFKAWVQSFTPNDPAFTESVRELEEWLTAHPLEAVADVKRVSSKQRELARWRLPLWLIARECLKLPTHAEAGQRISNAALESARLQTDNTYLLAMVREAGQMAWDAGDTATAATRWSELLDLIIVRNAPNTSATEGTEAANTTPAEKKVFVAPASIDQFKQSLELALLVETKELHDLSLKAVRNALLGGPPIQSSFDGSQRSGVIITRSDDDASASESDVLVSQGLRNVYQKWTRNQVPPEKIYEVLVSIVFPAARPNEILMYAEPISGSGDTSTLSVGGLLVKQAVAAKKEAEFKQLIETYAKKPQAEFPAQILLTMLAREMKDVPATQAALTGLAQVSERHQHQNAAELTCHVTLPAIDQPELVDLAQPLLLKAVRQLSSAHMESSRVNELLLRVARAEFKAGHNDPAKQLLDEYLKGQDSIYANYGGDYGDYMRKQTLQAIAGEYAKAGLLTDALAKLGEVADMPKFTNYGDSSDGTHAQSILTLLKKETPAEQYRILKEWTLPKPGRTTIRSIANLGPTDSPPEFIVKGLLALTGGTQTEKNQLESSAKLLVSSAEAVGKLDELAAEVQQLVDQKVPRARELQSLIRMRQKKVKEAAPEIKVMMNEMRDRPVDNESRAEPPWTEFQIAGMALADPEGQEIGQELARQLIDYSQRHGHSRFVPHLRYQLGQSLVSTYPGAQHVGGRDPGLKWWHGSTTESNWEHARGQTPVWWVAHEGVVSHLCGPDVEQLYFRYPLAGEFEFSVESYFGGWAEGNLQYAGLELIGLMGGGETTISPYGNSERIYLPAGPRRENQFMRHTLQVRPDRLRYLVNNVLLYEDTDPGHNSPWLALHVGSLQQASYRNFRITGNPIIPREVRLVEADRLEGWLSNFYQEVQPPRRQIGKAERWDADRIIQRDPDVNAYDWAAQDGIIHGRKHLNPHRQSRLYYHRPLQNGDTLAYEFYYSPQDVHVHPALDRLTFLLDPKGVRLHWMTDVGQSDIPAENVVDYAEGRRGPTPLPLQVDTWNAVKLMLADSVVRIELNGQLIYEAPLDAANRRQFGFFHDPTLTSVKVRNVILTGNWPTAFTPEMAQDLLAPDDTPLTMADRHARHALIGESMYLLGASDVLQRAHGLPDLERLTMLTRWVLPSEDHASYRVTGEFRAVDPLAQPQANSTIVASSESLAEFEGGSHFDVPAYEMIATAKALNQLEPLRIVVERSPAQTIHEKRCRLCLLSLIAMSEEKWTVAETLLAELAESQKQLTPEATVTERWPDVLAAHVGATLPVTRLDARRILDEAVNQAIRKNPGAGWDLVVRILRDRTIQQEELAARQLTPAQAPQPTQWVSANSATSRENVRGLPRGHWRFLPGEMRHYPGRGDDYLYFRSPLKGDFEMECELSSFDWREVDPLYAGMYVSLLYTLKESRQGRINNVLENVTLDQPMPHPGRAYTYKLTVKEGTATAFVNGQKLHERRLPERFVPWLGFHTFSPNASVIRNVRITGTPVIPEELDLLDLQELGDAWRGYYDLKERWWMIKGDELVSERHTSLADRHEQTLLQYHRPLAEDGELRYEFYYQAGTVNVHPALDRMAMLIQPDGVKVHWVIDPEQTDSQLLPGNVTALKELQRGPSPLPLKEGDWNVVTLRLKGRDVVLSLNETEIFARTLDSATPPTFGFFNFVGTSEARIRNIRYRGDWPRTLPSLAQQEMATGPAPLTRMELPHRLVWNGKRTNPAPFKILGIAPLVVPTPEGLQTRLPVGKDKPIIGVQLLTPIRGDFEVTATFNQLKAARAPNETDHAGPGIDLSLFISGKPEEWIKLERRITREMTDVLQIVHGEVASGTRQLWYVPQFRHTPEGQKLRIVRQGAVAYFLHAARDSDEFELLDHRVVGAGPIEKVEFFTRAFQPEHSAEALLEELVIKTKEPLASQ